VKVSDGWIPAADPVVVTKPRIEEVPGVFGGSLVLSKSKVCVLKKFKGFDGFELVVGLDLKINEKIIKLMCQVSYGGTQLIYTGFRTFGCSDLGDTLSFPPIDHDGLESEQCGYESYQMWYRDGHIVYHNWHYDDWCDDNVGFVLDTGRIREVLEVFGV
jgi:hypothetical protein